MSDFNIDLVYYRIWEGVQEFLKRCPNASHEAVEEGVFESVLSSFSSEYQFSGHEQGKLRRELTKAYRATYKGK
jgi:hypothetical protein